MSQLLITLVVNYCLANPEYDFYDCKNGIIQCYTDDGYTMKECIEEYEYENL